MNAQNWTAATNASMNYDNHIDSVRILNEKRMHLTITTVASKWLKKRNKCIFSVLQRENAVRGEKNLKRNEFNDFLSIKLWNFHTQNILWE